MNKNEIDETRRAAEILATSGTFLTERQLYNFMMMKSKTMRERIKIKKTFELYGHWIDNLCLKSFLKK